MPKAAKLTDRDIRKALLDRLGAPGPGERLVQEPRVGGGYLDLLLVRRDGPWEGWEIKSDVDSTDRLLLQTIHFKAPHLMHLVCAPRHLAKALTIIPPEWGVILATGAPGAVVLEVHRPATPAGDLGDRRALLWKTELRPWFRSAVPKPWPKSNAYEYREMMASLDAHLTPAQQDQAIADLLLARPSTWGKLASAAEAKTSAPLRAVVAKGLVYEVQSPRSPNDPKMKRTMQDFRLECGHVVPCYVPMDSTPEPKRRRCPGCAVGRAVGEPEPLPVREPVRRPLHYFTYGWIKGDPADYGIEPGRRWPGPQVG